MKRANDDLRKYAKDRGIFLYQVAKKMGISSYYFTVRLREPFSEKQRAKFIGYVDELAALNAAEAEDDG